MANLHDHILWAKTADSLHREIKSLRFCQKVKRDIVTRFLFVGTVDTDWPFFTYTLLIPVGSMPKFIVGVIFERNRRARGPFGMLFRNSLWGP